MERRSLIAILGVALGVGIVYVLQLSGFIWYAIFGAVGAVIGEITNIIIDKTKSKYETTREASADNDVLKLNDQELTREEYVKRQFDINYEDDFSKQEAAISGVAYEKKVSNSPIRGWLIILLILLILRLFQSIYYFYDVLPLLTSDDFGYLISGRNDLGIAALVEFLFNAMYLMIVGFSLYCMFLSLRLFKKIVIILFSFTLIGNIILYLFYIGLPETSDYIGESMRLILYSMIHAIIWIPYILKSKRVEKTFVK